MKIRPLDVLLIKLRLGNSSMHHGFRLLWIIVDCGSEFGGIDYNSSFFHPSTGPMAMLVQTLVVRDSRVLLGRWRSGAFCGRITGLLGSAPGVTTRPQGGAGCGSDMELYPLVNYIYKIYNYGKSHHVTWVNPLTINGHFQ